jgi:tetratricopeptide (TPR) repeat protein
MARKLALIIGNSQYDDKGLARLAAPDVDVRALAEVLSSPGIGAFDEVVPLLNEGLATVRRAIAQFFDAKHRDDLLVLYFSGHGVRDEQGHLYLAVKDTERSILAGTAIEASYVTTRMDRSASKRLVLVLDCCHSGAFGHGSKSAQGATVGTASAFEGTGRGRVVLTATDSTQYAWEGDQVIGEVENSLFTHYLIEGLRSGAADRDEDGQITIDELYDYVYDHVLSDTPKQTPGKWAFGQQGEIVIAQNPGVSVAKLPPELEEALKSTLPSVRLQVLTELYGTVRGRHEGRARAAREALQRLSEDDSRKVASGARIYLQALDRGEVLSEDDWARRVREREEEPSGRKTVAAQIEAYVSAAEASLERGALEDARELLARALKLDGQDATARRLQERLEQMVEERARLEEAERRIRELRQRIAGLIARANATTGHPDAIALLNEALGLDPEHAEVRQLLEARHRLVAEAEAAEQARRQQEADAAALVRAELDRRARIEGQLAEASRHLAREHLTKAIVITEAILRGDPDNTGARSLQAKAQGAIEAKRIAEEHAAAKADRQRQIEDMIATAEAAATHDTAIDILNEVLVRDPGNTKAKRLLAKRQAALRQPEEVQQPEVVEVPEIRPLVAVPVTSDSAKGFSAQPTVVAQRWTWVRGAALRSNTFRLASVILFASAFTWGVLSNAPTGSRPATASDTTTASAGPEDAAPGATPAAPPPAGTTGPDAPAETVVPETVAAGRTEPSARGRGTATSPEGRAAKPPIKTPEKSSATSPAAETKTPAAVPSVTPTTPTGVNPPAGEREKPKTEDPVKPPSADPPRPESPKLEPAPAPKAVPDEASLRLAVRAYEEAISSGDHAAIRRVFPAVTDSELREIDTVKVNFGRGQYRLTVLIRDPGIEGTKARVRSRLIHSGIDDRGKPLDAKARDETLRFEWNGGTWVRVR